jgi:rare lipoprotein A
MPGMDRKEITDAHSGQRPNSISDQPGSEKSGRFGRFVHSVAGRDGNPFNPLLAVLQTQRWSVLLMCLLAYNPISARAEPSTGQQASWAGESGYASYYGRAHQGRRTAFGARFDQGKLTAAHPWLPFGSQVLVTVAGTGRSVIVTITDRLYSNRRVIDLSLAAARSLGIVGRGVAMVSLAPG